MEVKTEKRVFKVVKFIPPDEGRTMGVTEGKGYEQKYSFIPGKFNTFHLERNPATNKIELDLSELASKYFKDAGETQRLDDYLEKNLSLDPGTLSKVNHNNPFWQEYKVRLDEINHFYMDNAIDVLKVKVLESLPYIAPSLEETNEFKYRGAQYYFDDPERTASIKEKEQESKEVAFTEFGQLSPSDRRKFSRRLGILKGSETSDKIVKTNLFSYIELGKKQRESFLRLLRDQKKDQDRFDVHEEVLLAMELNLIKNKGGKFIRIIDDTKEGSELGVNEESVVDFYLSSKNGDLRDQLVKDINNKINRTT